MINFIDMRDFYTDRQATTPRRITRQIRHTRVYLPSVTPSGAEPAGESRSVVKTAPKRGLYCRLMIADRRFLRSVKSKMSRVWRSSLVIEDGVISWEVPNV
jgi:hypothetical protein